MYKRLIPAGTFVWIVWVPDRYPVAFVKELESSICHRPISMAANEYKSVQCAIKVEPKCAKHVEGVDGLRPGQVTVQRSDMRLLPKK